MYRFVPLFSNGPTPGILDVETGRVYERPEYTDVDIGSLARWLNDRESNYKTPDATILKRA